MKSPDSESISIDQLRVGLYIELDLGWMSHPFPSGSFKIVSNRQIEALRGLGLKSVRWVPSKSDPPEDAASSSRSSADEDAAAKALARESERRRARAQQIGAQQYSLRVCEQRFTAAQEVFRRVQEDVMSRPLEVKGACQALIGSYVAEISGGGESAIRLLSERMGERSAMHPVNVTVMSLLLGKAMGLHGEELENLGMAAFLHDIGKLDLPQRLRWFEDSFSIDEFRLYQEHVGHGVAMGKRMGLNDSVLRSMAQHHELLDGSGFPAKPAGDDIALGGRILALVNRYDNLCNPVRLVTAMTPHEALSLLFAQHKARFDNVVLSAFIRMMGVYPPGSVVQLVDGRFAMVVSVNTVRPLKPRVIVHESTVPKHEALILDLEAEPTVGIRRSLRPTALPGDALDYLAPRQRVAYHYEPPAMPQGFSAPVPVAA
jgi:HD-GYP domain-containing protein (c-di-GMP phosphodiesterase class II)